MNFELLPQGAFSIRRNSGQVITGRFCMWSLDHFCRTKGIGDSIYDLLFFIQKPIGISAFADYIFSAVLFTYKNDISQCQVTRDDILEVMEEAGSTRYDMMAKMLNHSLFLYDGLIEDTKKKTGKVTVPVKKPRRAR
ncbi:MAG: hypothetical protein J0M30_14820 [Chitinophagales bacterium]|nr:hypothetical protein [Chitinophagales bacterium]